MSDLNTKLELARLLASIETFGRELSVEDALEFYRHLGTRSAIIRQRLSREGCFRENRISNGQTVILSAVAAKVG